MGAEQGALHCDARPLCRQIALARLAPHLDAVDRLFGGRGAEIAVGSFLRGVDADRLVEHDVAIEELTLRLVVADAGLEPPSISTGSLKV